jgi:hypothetical protein
MFDKKNTSCTSPDSVTTVGPYAFFNATHLREIVFSSIASSRKEDWYFVLIFNRPNCLIRSNVFAMMCSLAAITLHLSLLEWDCSHAGLIGLRHISNPSMFLPAPLFSSDSGNSLLYDDG